MTDEKEGPDGWGSDDLTRFLDSVRNNQFATFEKKQQVKTLITIDALYLKILDGAINPKPIFPFLFMHRTHSALRAACGLLMAGQVLESNALMRLALETASYGFYVSTSDKIANVWVNRETGPAEEKEARKVFQHINVRNALLSKAPKIADMFGRLYDRTIAYGAHPNESGFSLNTQLSKGADRTKFEQIYLQGDGKPLDLTLVSLIQVGFCTLKIFQLVYSQKFELLGIRTALENF